MKETDRIFLIDESGDLKEMPYTYYENEGILQELIDKHPELIVGDQINPEEPPRWLVVYREAGIPDSEFGSNRRPLDNLLIDQYGRLTLVEVKSSSESRIRREVVVQMLDYAANSQVYWLSERIQTLAAENAGGLDSPWR